MAVHRRSVDPTLPVCIHRRVKCCVRLLDTKAKIVGSKVVQEGNAEDCYQLNKDVADQAAEATRKQRGSLGKPRLREHGGKTGGASQQGGKMRIVKPPRRTIPAEKPFEIFEGPVEGIKRKAFWN